MVIYSYPVEKKGKERSSTVWIIKKEKSIGTLRMYFSCFRLFWVCCVTPRVCSILLPLVSTHISFCKPWNCITKPTIRIQPERKLKKKKNRGKKQDFYNFRYHFHDQHLKFTFAPAQGSLIKIIIMIRIKNNRLCKPSLS